MWHFDSINICKVNQLAFKYTRIKTKNKCIWLMQRTEPTEEQRYIPDHLPATVAYLPKL
jgi:hypothetical protein